MNIPAEAKAQWESLRQKGDIPLIVDASGYSAMTVKNALNGEECTIEVFTAIQEFYNKRQAAINELMNPQDNAQA